MIITTRQLTMTVLIDKSIAFHVFPLFFLTRTKIPSADKTTKQILKIRCSVQPNFSRIPPQLQGMKSL